PAMRRTSASSNATLARNAAAPPPDWPAVSGPAAAYSRPERFTPHRRIGPPVSRRTRVRPRTASGGRSGGVAETPEDRHDRGQSHVDEIERVEHAERRRSVVRGEI